MMRVAVDTNVLVYAHRADMRQHDAARAAIVSLLESGDGIAVPMTVAVEFVRVVTNTRLWEFPTSTEIAVEFIDELLAMDGVGIITSSNRGWPVMRRIFESTGAVGVDVFDAAIAAAMTENDVRCILTNDRWFEQVDGVDVQRIDA